MALGAVLGAGQVTERVGDPGYLGRSPADLAAEAARIALDNASLGAADIDTIIAIRTFDDSMPNAASFGTPANFPRAIARRLGAEPARAVLGPVGGDTPLTLCAEALSEIVYNRARHILLVSGEAISTTRHLRALGETRDWAESRGGQLDDRGPQLDTFLEPADIAHRAALPLAGYALLETARRARLGLAPADYATAMGELFAPFARTAAANPLSATRTHATGPESLAVPSPQNRIVATPYTQKLVSRDQVNQAAALVLGPTRPGAIHIHGYAALTERRLLDRNDLGASPAAARACQLALERAGKTPAEIALWDFYSCFPIAVFATAIDALGLAPDGSVPLTVTGGLPYFGGPGNAYSLHALAEMTMLLRAKPGAYGFVGANGGILSKYAAGIFSADRPRGTESSDASAQAELDRRAAPPRWAALTQAEADIETATVVTRGDRAAYAVAITRIGGARAYVLAESGTAGALLDVDPVGQRIRIEPTGDVNVFTLI